ncbi:MAG: hypothetical protein GY711_30460 [bacterium]|nr:hypothetical protein [bacterium]
MSDGCLIRYVPGQMSIFMDDLVSPALTVALDLTTYPDLPWGWAGFTAASGSSREDHDILDWRFTEGSDCLATTYCTNAVNSTGFAAEMSMAGSLSVVQNDLWLSVAHCPDEAFGLFFYGQGEVQFPLGDGYLCVSPYAPGLFRIMPIVQADPSGEAGMPIDLNALPSGGEIEAGSTWNFQFWYRDPAAGNTGSNLSNAIRASFCL